MQRGLNSPTGRFQVPRRRMTANNGGGDFLEREEYRMASDKWFQMWVSHPHDAISVMKRADPILQRFTCLPNAPDGTPVMRNGVIEVRGYNEMGFRMAKYCLEDQGFVIEREQTND